MTINFDHLPVEPTATLIDPDGKDLITTNNPIAILHARAEIKRDKLTGYKRGETTNMILFAIIGENLGLVESATVTSATIIDMLIVCWAIYTVYTGEFCNL